MRHEEILKYLDNEMSESEARNFEKNLKSDSTLYQEYQNVLAAKKAAKNFMSIALKRTLQNTPLESEKNSSDKSTKNVRRNWALLFIRLGVAAASLAFIFILYKWLDEGPELNETLLMAQIYEEPVWPLTRGQNTHFTEAVAIAVTVFSDSSVNAVMSYDTTAILKKYWVSELKILHKRFDDPQLQQDLKDLVTQGYFKDRCQILLACYYIQHKDKTSLKQLFSTVDLKNSDENTSKKWKLIEEWINQ